MKQIYQGPSVRQSCSTLRSLNCNWCTQLMICSHCRMKVFPWGYAWIVPAPPEWIQLNVLKQKQLQPQSERNNHIKAKTTYLAAWLSVTLIRAKYSSFVSSHNLYLIVNWANFRCKFNSSISFLISFKLLPKRH